MMYDISDAALDSYYARTFEYSHGYDPLDGPYEEDYKEDEDGRTHPLEEDD